MTVPPVKQHYRWSPAWNIQVLDDDGVRVSAGADLTFEIRDLGANDIFELNTWVDRSDLERPENPEQRALFDQLVVLQAIVPKAPRRAVPYRVRWLGAEWPELGEQIVGTSTQESDDEADTVLVLVRTNATWTAVLDALPTLGPHPYLFVDVAYDHTLSIGPYAIPGETSCAGCLAGRIIERWGDYPPPDRPRALESSALIAALIRLELARIASGAPGFVNATSTWDLAAGSSKREALYRVPVCPSCANENMSGQLSLSWCQ